MGLFFILRRGGLYHKLRYSKTLKGDAAGAALGLIVGLFCGYLALASVGACAIDLSDLTTLMVYLGLATLVPLLVRGIRVDWRNVASLLGL